MPRFSSSISGIVSLEATYDAYTDTAGTVQATTDGDVVAAFKNGGINMVQATSGQRPIFKTGIGFNGKPTLSFDGVDDGLADTALSFGTNSTTIVIGVDKQRGSSSNEIIISAGSDTRNFFVAGTDLSFYNGSTIVTTSGMGTPPYQAMMAAIATNTTLSIYIDDKSYTVSGSALSTGTGLSIGTGGGATTEIDVTHVLVHPTVGLSSGQMTTLIGELRAYYGSVPQAKASGKRLVVSDGNSYNSAGAFATLNSNEYLYLASASLGTVDMRCIGAEGKTINVGTVNSLTGNATYLDSYAASVGSSNAQSVLVVGEGVNQSTGSAFADFQTYIAARLAAGWGQIVVLAPCITNGWSPGGGGSDATVTAFYNAVMAATWPAKVKICNLRQAPFVTYNATYFSDVVHWNDAGHAAAAPLVQSSIFAALAALSSNGSGIFPANFLSPFTTDWMGSFV